MPAPPRPPAPPSPADVAKALTEAQSQVSSVVNAAATELREVGEAAASGMDDVSSAVTEAANAILGAVNRGVGDLQRSQAEAIRRLQELIGTLPDVEDLGLAGVYVNDHAIVPPDPVSVYRRVVAAIERGESPIRIRVQGPMLASPLLPLTRSRDEMRNDLLTPFGLQNSAILTPNPGDAVLITAIICLTICFLAATLLPAIGVGVIFIALGAAIVIGVSNGYDIKADICHEAGITLSDLAGVPIEDCVVLNLTKRAS